MAEPTEFKFEIRPLNMRDIAPMARIVSKIGVGEFGRAFDPEFVRGLMAQDGKVDAVGMGMALEMLGVVTANYDKAEKDITAFLASVSGMTVKEVGALSLADTAELVIAVFRAEDFGDFFTRVRALLGSDTVDG